MDKVLTLYFSRKGQNYTMDGIEELEVGNTERCAKFIQDAVGGDMFEVTTEHEYPDDYYECTEEARAELREDAKPALAQHMTDIDGYETVFICSPVWWGHLPQALKEQLQMLHWDGKIVALLTTHEGSGLGDCEQEVREICKGAKVAGSLPVPGSHAAQSEVSIADWAKQIAGPEKP